MGLAVDRRRWDWQLEKGRVAAWMSPRLQITVCNALQTGGYVPHAITPSPMLCPTRSVCQELCSSLGVARVEIWLLPLARMTGEADINKITICISCLMTMVLSTTSEGQGAGRIGRREFPDEVPKRKTEGCPDIAHMKGRERKEGVLGRALNGQKS